MSDDPFPEHYGILHGKYYVRFAKKSGSWSGAEVSFSFMKQTRSPGN